MMYVSANEKAVSLNVQRYNKGDNPYDAAEMFLENNDLPPGRAAHSKRTH
jgi:hypothetical protein